MDRAVIALSLRAAEASSLGSLLQHAAKVVAGSMETDVVWVLQVAPGGRSLLMAANVGLDTPQSMADILSNHAGSMSARTLKSGRTLVVRDIASDRRWSRAARGHDGSMVSGISVVIKGSPKAFGVLTGRCRTAKRYSSQQVEFMNDVADLLSVTVTRIAAEGRARASETSFRLLAEHAPDVVIRTRMRPEPTLEYISPSIFGATGYTPEELYKSPERWNMTHPSDRPTAEAFLAAPDTAPFPAIMRWIRKDGSTAWMELRVNRILDQRGRLVSLETIARDVTDRIYAERRREASVEVTNSMLEGRDAQQTLRLIALRTAELLTADLVVVLRQRAGGAVEISVSVGDESAALEGTHLKTPYPLLDRASLQEAPTMVDDLASILPRNHPLAKLGLVGPGLLAPLRRNGSLVGMLVVANTRKPRRFVDRDLSALDSLARQAVLALEYGQARDEVQRLAVLEDRSRIARELHDGVIQALFGAGMGLQALAETPGLPKGADGSIARVNQIIDNAMQDLRNYVFDLQPTALIGRDLPGALQLLARDFEATSGIPCTVSVSAPAGGPPGMSAQIVQILREALSNVSQHAAASSCQINVRQTDGELLLEVIDNGRGFLPRSNGGQGLSNMRRRAAELGGSAEIISSLGSGTIVRLLIPVHRPE
jgi:PAS domain S-box-containing protein